MKCVDCKNWRYCSQEDDLSDVTPGEKAEFYCTYNHFYFLGYSITTEVFRKTLCHERNCDNYIKYEV